MLSSIVANRLNQDVTGSYSNGIICGIVGGALRASKGGMLLSSLSC